MSPYVDVDPQFTQEFAPEVLTDRSAVAPSFNVTYDPVDPQFQNIFEPELLTQTINNQTLSFAAPELSGRMSSYVGPTGYTAEEMAAYNAQVAANAEKGVYASQAQTMAQALANMQESKAYTQAVADLKTALSNFNPEAPVQVALPDLPAPIDIPTLAVASYAPQQNAPTQVSQVTSAPEPAAPAAPSFSVPSAPAPSGPTAMSSTSYDLKSEVPGISDYIGFGGTQGQAFQTASASPSEGPTGQPSQDLALNTSAIYDLSNYLSFQNTNQAPANVSPYVDVPAATVAQSVVPEFSSISYPTAPT